MNHEIRCENDVLTQLLALVVSEEDVPSKFMDDQGVPESIAGGRFDALNSVGHGIKANLFSKSQHQSQRMHFCKPQMTKNMLGRRRHQGKTSFVEHRTFLRLYHSFHRLWIFLVMMFQPKWHSPRN
ncbi:Callose synthase 9, partial [Cucurbita argyrosperma subsp. argyrosperma]